METENKIINGENLNLGWGGFDKMKFLLLMELKMKFWMLKNLEMEMGFSKKI